MQQLLWTFLKWRVDLNIPFTSHKVVKNITKHLFKILGINNQIRFFFNFCKSYQPVSTDLQTSKVGNYLILQLKHFVNHNSDFMKYFTNVHCTKTLSVALAVDEVIFHKKFSLTATANYMRTYNTGHYTAFIRQSNFSSLFFCNDAAVFRSSVQEVNNTSSHIYI